MIEDSTEAWVTGQLALALLAVDPQGLNGLHLRARAGPVRDAFLKDMPQGLAGWRKIAPGISDTQLYGGVDIAATLAEGRVVQSAGLLAGQDPLMLTMAERCTPALAARLAQALDLGTAPMLMMLDEGAEPEERAPTCLIDRVAFSLDLDGLRVAAMADLALEPEAITHARARLPAVIVPDDVLAALTVTAVRFGVQSLRAPLLAVAAARAHAALAGRDRVVEEDVTLAAQLVFAHRATCLPSEEQTEESPPEPEPEQSTDPSDNAQSDERQDLPAEMLIEAVKALLPPDVLAGLTAPNGLRGAKGSGGAGQKRKGNRRGRPLPSRPGKISGAERIDIVATLRAAAPWQPVRRKAQPDAKGLLLRPSDIHVRRFQEMSDRLVIFTVDASGSSAVARLSEAKGAVEQMLGEAYARRDHVALIAFRGDGAELVLPPTRSLVQTKRRLAGLPGGGGTPLASGLQCAADVARRALGHGLSPALALLTDGRANVPLPGRSGRAAAKEDAEAMARNFARLCLPAAVVDTSVRPQRDLRHLAALLGGRYVPLPRADASRISAAVGQALES